MKEITVTIQYIDNCPLKSEMIRRTKQAIARCDGSIALKLQKISTIEESEKFIFRGSPTLLINEADYERVPPPREPFIGCRLYRRGLPSSDDIYEKLVSAQK